MIFWATALNPNGEDSVAASAASPLVRIVSDGKRGTAFFIHPLVAVTCAHNVVQAKNGGLYPPKRIWLETSGISLWPEWMVVPDELTGDASSIVPYADVAALRVRSEWPGPLATIGALPHETGARVWRMEGPRDVTFTPTFPHLVFEPATDWAGSSGAPVVCPPGPLEATSVVAMHRLFSFDEDVGKALHLTPEDAAQMLSALGI